MERKRIFDFQDLRNLSSMELKAPVSVGIKITEDRVPQPSPIKNGWRLHAKFGIQDGINWEEEIDG
jgi:hypothetical protein